MAFSRNHAFVSAIPDGADATVVRPSNWNANHGITDAVSGGIPYFSSTTAEGTSALLAANSLVIGGGAGAAPFTSADLSFNDTTDVLTTKTYSSTAGGGGAIITTTGFGEFLRNSGSLWIISASGTYPLSIGTTGNASIQSTTGNAFTFAAATNAGSGAPVSRTAINKSVTAIADNTATTVFTVTIPNAAHSASIRVRLTGSMGAGGAIGANESTQDAEYMINVARTAGVNAVATIGAVVGQAAAAAVAGAGTVAVTGTLGAIAGAVGAANTFTIQVTIVKSGGSSANHTCLGFAELLNANTTGISIA